MIINKMMKKESSSSAQQPFTLQKILCGMVDDVDDCHDHPNYLNVNKMYKQLVLPPKQTQMFRKSEYLDIIKTKREEFILENFSSEIERLSESLRQDATKMKGCNCSWFFNIPDMYDISKVDTLLQEYFRDCGYTVVSTREEKDFRVVKITLS